MGCIPMGCWLLPPFAGRFRLFAPRASARGRGLAGAANESASPAGRSVDVLQGRQKVDAQATIGLRPLYRPPVADLQWVLSPHNHCAPRRRFAQEPLRKSPVSPCSALADPWSKHALASELFLLVLLLLHLLLLPSLFADIRSHLMPSSRPVSLPIVCQSRSPSLCETKQSRCLIFRSYIEIHAITSKHSS